MIRAQIDMEDCLPLTREHAVAIVQTAEGFACRIMLEREKGAVNAKSILGLLSLSDAKHVSLLLDGEDEKEALTPMLAVLMKHDGGATA